MLQYEEPGTINVGTGSDCTIAELAVLMKEITHYEGAITFDTSKPDGTPRKLLDVSRLQALGWGAAHSLAVGLRQTYEWAVVEGVLS
jgi:GDP-L-fucose synthase